ncbi:MAG: hypothetical protein HN392_09225 [Anaerolineae bacterium]|jgi:hypothetical protein|nr:hypothetical protein [Anaerolineae bacterium]MBT7076016.1 hypothetical protein [Anaerolineae bacterium]
MSNETNSSPSFLSRLGQASIKFLRAASILAVVSIIGLIIYFGLPYIYKKIILPVETNTARLAEFEDNQFSEIEQLDKQVSGMQERMNDLENRHTENAQNLAEMQGEIEALEADLESAIRAHNKTLENLEIIEDNLGALFERSDEYENVLADGTSAIANMQRQVSLSRSIELLSRAQLYLSQSNFGLAKEDVENAINLLLTLEKEMPEARAEALANIIEKLELANKNLPNSPTIAVDSLNIAWQLLVNDLPELPEVKAEPPDTESP